MTKKIKLILLFIFLLSFSLRLFNSSRPPLLWDEASLGYNAYSILKTAKDEYGTTYFPLILKSFGDYKPGFYVYLALPFVALFGLNPLSTRLPSVLLGSFMPVLLYLLISKFQKEKSQKLPLISALVLAITPQAIHFSRGAWETNILTFQLLLGSFFFFMSQKKKRSLYLTLSSLVFASSLYTYQGAKLMTPLVIVSLYLSFNSLNKNIFKKFLSDKKLLKAFVLPLFLISLPYIFSLLTSQSGNRLIVTGLFSYKRPENEIQQIISESNKLDYSLLHNQTLFFLRGASSRYFNHLSPTYLTFEGDWSNPRHSAPYIGILLYPSIIFLLIGFLKNTNLFLNKKTTPLLTFMTLWFFLAPLPAALSRDSIHAVRSMSQVIPLVFFVALGIKTVLDLFKPQKLITLLISLSFLISLFFYLDLYHSHMVEKSPKDFLYGYEQASTYLANNIDRYNQVVFSGHLGQPYIYYLFWSQYPPKKYQAQVKLTEDRGVDTGRVEKIDNIHFRPVNWDTDSKLENTLLIITHEDVLRLSLDKNQDFFSKFTPLSPIGNTSTFYLYETKKTLNYAQN